VSPAQAWVQEQLGVDEVVDYTSADVVEVYAAADKHFDIIIDCLVSGAPCMPASLLLLYGADLNVLLLRFKSNSRMMQISTVLGTSGHYDELLALAQPWLVSCYSRQHSSRHVCMATMPKPFLQLSRTRVDVDPGAGVVLSAAAAAAAVAVACGRTTLRNAWPR
jgi:hypothetical protein